MIPLRHVVLLGVFTIASVASADIQISGISPSTAPSSGGTSVVISGSGFFGGCPAAPCAPVEVLFGGEAAQSVRVESDSRIVAVTPEYMPQTGLAYGTYDYPPVVAVVVKTGASSLVIWTFTYSDLIGVPDLTNSERLLLPTYVDAAGAYGSHWKTDFSIYNGSAAPVAMYPVFPWTGTISGASIPPHRMVIPQMIEHDKYFPYYPSDAPRSGRVVYVDAAHADEIHANLRIYDDSRKQTTWGTEEPVVRERDLRSTAVELFPVPLDRLFRQSLRIYDPFRLGNGEVEIRFFLAQSGTLVTTKKVMLPVYQRTMDYGGVDQSFPGLAELNNLMLDVPDLQALPPSAKLRLEIVPLTFGLRFWAMVSLTNNDTQQVTLVTPQ